MATTTTNLALTKSLGTENYSIDIVNANLDKIDAGCVNVTQAQDISGYKKFTSTIARKATNVNMTSAPSSQETAVHFDGLDNNGTPIVRFRTYHETSGASELSIIVPKQGWDGNADYQQPRLRMISSTGGTISLSLSKANQTYNSSATEQILTVGLLQASTDVVHRSGNEMIAGVKTNTNTHSGITRISVGVRVATSAESTAGTEWFKVCDVSMNSKLLIEGYSRYSYLKVIIAGSNTLQINSVISKAGGMASVSNYLLAAYNSTTTKWEIWFKNPNSNNGNHMTFMFVVDDMSNTNNNPFDRLTPATTFTPTTIPTVGATYSVVSVII